MKVKVWEFAILCIVLMVISISIILGIVWLGVTMLQYMGIL